MTSDLIRRTLPSEIVLLFFLVTLMISRLRSKATLLLAISPIQSLGHSPLASLDYHLFAAAFENSESEAPKAHWVLSLIHGHVDQAS